MISEVVSDNPGSKVICPGRVVVLSTSEYRGHVAAVLKVCDYNTLFFLEGNLSAVQRSVGANFKKLFLNLQILFFYLLVLVYEFYGFY